MTENNSSKTAPGGLNEDGAAASSSLPLRTSPHKPLTTAERLRHYSALSTDEALTQLGNPDLGDARSSTSTLELDSIASTGPTAPPHHRRLKVDVTLSVSNDGSSPPPPVTPNPQPCPPYRPAPGPSRRWPWLIIALLVLALLVMFGLNQLGQTDTNSTSSVYSGTSDSTTASTRAGIDHALPAVPNSPTVASLDATVMPANTPNLNQGGDLVCDGRYYTINQVPEFAKLHTQNWVHDAATQWQVRCVENEGGATVVALDASHNVINRQIYGSFSKFEEQVTFVQSTDAAGFRTVQVDFYAPFNTFIGRTIYRFDSSNRVSDAYRQDGFQRPLQASHITHDENGLITSVTTDKTPRGGGGRTVAYTKTDIESATRVYYDFDSFN